MPKLTTNLDADTAAVAGVPTHLRSGGIGAAEDTHYGSLSQALKPGATNTGATDTEIVNHLDTIFPERAIHPFAVEPLGGRDTVIQTIPELRDMPRDLIAAILGGAQESPYGGALRSPQLDPVIQQRMRTLYPHKPGPEVAIEPGNKPNAYLRNGLLAKAALQEAFQRYKEDGDAEAFKAVAKVAFKDDAILEAHAWERGMLSLWERKLQSGPMNQNKFPANPLPWYSQALNMVTGQTPDITTPEYHQSAWEVTTHVGPLSNLRFAISNAAVSSKPDPEARRLYEELRTVAPKDLMEWADKSGKSDQGKYMYVLNALAEQSQTRKANELAGVDAVKGFLGMGASAIPTMLIGGPVLKGVGAAGAKVVEMANASLAARALGTVSNPLSNAWGNAAAKGAVGMYGFQVGASGLADTVWDHPGSEQLDLTPHKETLLLGMALGLFGHAVPTTYKKLTAKTSDAARLVNSIQAETTPITDLENPHLKDPTPGNVQDPAEKLKIYQRIQELMSPGEKRPRTEAEAEELETLKKHVLEATAAAKRPRAGNLTSRINTVIAHLKQGLPQKVLLGDGTAPPLEELLGVFKDSKGNLPESLKGELLRATLNPNETGDVTPIHREILGGEVATTRIKAGQLAAWDYQIQRALRSIDTAGVVAPKAERNFRGNKYPGLSSTELEGMQKALSALETTHPEIVQELKAALAHHEHLSGDLTSAKARNDLAILLEAKPDIITEFNVPEGKIDLERVHPDHRAEAERINEAIAALDKELPIHSGKSRFRDESETLKQPNALDLINADPKRGAAFRNKDAFEWHQQKLKEEFKHMEQVVFDEETGKFVKFETKAEPAEGPDTLPEDPC